MSPISFPLKNRRKKTAIQISSVRFFGWRFFCSGNFLLWCFAPGFVSHGQSDDFGTGDFKTEAVKPDIVALA